MRTLESWPPRRGLSIPAVSVIDGAGHLLEEDQRRLTRYLIQSGRGADIVFANGTTGESALLRASTRRRLLEVVVEEVRKRNSRLVPVGHHPVEAWVGVTAPTREETLASLDLALEIGADAAVLAPLGIRDVADPVRFVGREVGDLLDARDRRIPVFLYDNADIASGRERRLRTRWVKLLSRLDFVRGIKVSAPPRRLGHYAKAARQFRDLGPFAIYVGNASYVFEMMRPREGLLGAIVEHWYRFRLRDMLPAGVVAGPANLLPREWQHAWQVASAGDVGRMGELSGIFERLRAACAFPGGRRTIAALKRGLLHLGVTRSDAVALGTPALSAEEARRFDGDLDEIRARIASALPPRWRSDPSEADAAS